MQAILEEALGPEHPDVAGSLNNLGDLLHHLGRNEESLTACERAQALWEKVLRPEHPYVGLALINQGHALLALGRYAQARAVLERALALWEKALGLEHPELAHPLEALGALRLESGLPAEAVPLLERALALTQGDKASIQFTLARALWDSGQQRRRAVELARQAREHWQRLGHPKLAEVSQWLASHAQ